MTKKISFTPEQAEMFAALTDLQRKFIIELIKPGISQRQAYINAGGTSKDELGQDASASRILSDVKVRPMYDSLMQSRAAQSVFSRDEALKIVADIAKSDEVLPNHRVQAVKQASDMEGWNAPKRTELSGVDGGKIQTSTDVSAPEIAAALAGLMDKL